MKHRANSVFLPVGSNNKLKPPFYRMITVFRSKVIYLGLVLLFSASLESIAAVDIVKFDDPQKDELYKELIQELRCLVCQNQNLADSNAELAKDLRRKTREMVEQGKSRSDIADYMVARYGEFVLYRPPLNKRTLILWFAPLILLLAAFGLLIRNRNKKKSELSVFSEADMKKAHDLLGSAGSNRVGKNLTDKTSNQ